MQPLPVVASSVCRVVLRDQDATGPRLYFPQSSRDCRLCDGAYPRPDGASPTGLHTGYVLSAAFCCNDTRGASALVCKLTAVFETM